MVAGGASDAGRIVLRGHAGARASADNLIVKLKAKLSAAKGELQRLRALVAAPPDASVAAEVARREAIALPALQALVEGSQVPGIRRLERNCAFMPRTARLRGRQSLTGGVPSMGPAWAGRSASAVMG